jgi:hypothetical protein
MEEKRLRQMVTIRNFLKANNAEEHFICLDKTDHKLHVVITRNNELKVHSQYCQLGGSKNYGGLTLEQAHKILDFINQE